MIKTIFYLTAHALDKTAKCLGLTYNEVNVIFYYAIIPLTWCIMLDIWLGCAVTTPLLALAWTVTLFAKRKNFSRWCDKVFRMSQDFLLFFGEYKTSSVVICVLIPIIIYVALILMLI